MNLHNKRNIKLVIFSVEQADVSKEENTRRSNEVERVLNERDIPYKRIIGSYKGQLESSFIVPKRDFFGKGFNVVAFGGYNQETILLIERDNSAVLIDNDYNEQKIGTLKQVTPAEAQNYEAFSIDGNSAYIIE